MMVITHANETSKLIMCISAASPCATAAFWGRVDVPCLQAINPHLLQNTPQNEAGNL